LVPEPEKPSDEQANIISESRGRKRKGDEADEPVGMPPKRRCSNSENLIVETGVETADEPSDSLTGSEERGISGELKERAGKPTLSGRVPLMPAHLAEGGYQGGKKRGPREETTYEETKVKGIYGKAVIERGG
jgi:hypothetical protein